MMGSLPPFPEGWYFVASRQSILKKKLIQKTWMGEEIVAWCDDDGQICVSSAICPHLGSNLGPGSGAVVHDGCLVCPFHGYAFAVDGNCVATPYAPPPKATRLKVFETREVLGIVFAWWGIDGRPPQWHFPEDPETGPEWSRLRFQTIRFKGHPQETTENAVDLAHLRYVHGFHNVSRADPLVVNGAFLVSNFNFKRTQRIAKVVNIDFDIAARTDIYGLGYSLVEIHERSIEMRARLWVLATPVDGTVIDLVLVSQVREIRKPKRPIVGIGFLPLRVRHRIMNKFLVSIQRQEVMQDVDIWEHKRYVARPRLCRSDGEIGRFRRYCKQFYLPDSGYNA